MIDEIHRRLAEKDFKPFTVVSRSGTKYRIASRDHVGFSPKGSRVLIWFDDDTTALVTALHMTAIEEESPWEPTRPGTTAS